MPGSWKPTALSVDESSLTGESVPVDKDASVVLAADAPLAERLNQVYTSTLVTRGRARALVVGYGHVHRTGAHSRPGAPGQRAPHPRCNRQWMN